MLANVFFGRIDSNLPKSYTVKLTKGQPIPNLSRVTIEGSISKGIATAGASVSVRITPKDENGLTYTESELAPFVSSFEGGYYHSVLK